MGGQVNGQQVDPLTFILAQIAMHYGPPGEEQRLQKMNNLLTFHRKRGESTEALLTRFMSVRHQSEVGGNVVVNHEGLSMILMKAVGVSSDQFLQLTERWNHRLPINDAEFSQLTTSLRRMGRIIERAP